MWATEPTPPVFSTVDEMMELQRQQIKATERQQLAWTRIGAERNAIALVTDINPTVRPEGELVLADGALMRWAATPDFDRKLLIEAGQVADMVAHVVNLPRGVTMGEILLQSVAYL